MGATASATPQVLLQSPIQLHLLRQNVTSDVAELLKGWSEEGMPLGLSCEEFAELWCLADQEQAQQFFDTFDTDRNRKIDALEAFAASAVICKGTIDEKVSALFPIFDFARGGAISFDEANILVHSVSRGLSKVCCCPPVDDAELLGACRSMFDTHNLAYDKSITHEQFRRWVRVDADAAQYADAFHQAVSIPDLQSSLADSAQAQAEAFAALRQSVPGGAVSTSALLSSPMLRQALGSPSNDEFNAVVNGIVRHGGPTISDESFAEGARAWNIFYAVCSGSSSREVAAKELIVLLRLWGVTANSFSRSVRKDFSVDDVAEERTKMGLSGEEKVTLLAWLNSAIPP